MGYDDNSKLTGVTGGGLPAEIWRETMQRVHEGLPVRPLPLIDPRNEPPRIANEIDNLVNDVSNTLLGDLINSLFGKPRR